MLQKNGTLIRLIYTDFWFLNFQNKQSRIDGKKCRSAKIISKPWQLKYFLFVSFLLIITATSCATTGKHRKPRCHDCPRFSFYDKTHTQINLADGRL
jgi:hypothetical protein